MGYMMGLQQWVAKLFFKQLVVTRGGCSHLRIIHKAIHLPYVVCYICVFFDNKKDFKTIPLDRTCSRMRSLYQAWEGLLALPVGRGSQFTRAGLQTPQLNFVTLKVTCKMTWDCWPPGHQASHPPTVPHWALRAPLALAMKDLFPISLSCHSH